MFEKASKLKIRFETEKGNLTVEDLWDLSLNDIDELAKSLDKQVRDSGQKSFVQKKTTVDEVLELKFGLVKTVIKGRLQDMEDAEKIAKSRAKKAKILEIIANKKDEKLQNSSISELKKMLQSL